MSAQSTGLRDYPMKAQPQLRPQLKRAQHDAACKSALELSIESSLPPGLVTPAHRRTSLLLCSPSSIMTTVPWQLIPTEDTDLEPIGLKSGATLLGKGQRASPGLEHDSISRTAARVQVTAGRIQLTSMSHPGFLRIASSEITEVKKLARGQAALLALGDVVDFCSVIDVNAPSSQFTYMLAECFPDEPDIQVGSRVNIFSPFVAIGSLA